MICPYCKNKVSGVGWGSHSKTCAERKYIRSGQVPEHPAILPPASDTVKTGEAIGKPRNAEDQAPEIIVKSDDLEDMSRAGIIGFLEIAEIPHDPRAKKKDLLKLAKGE